MEKSALEKWKKRVIERGNDGKARVEEGLNECSVMKAEERR